MLDDGSRWMKGVSVFLAIGLLVLFGIIVWFTLQTYDSPPRLADPAPTVLPTPREDGKLPQQYRASYDPNARLLGVLAIVTPLLTTIVGFFFGQRAGAARGEVAVSESRKKQAQIGRVLAETEQTEALQLLSDQGLIPPSAHPKASSGDSSGAGQPGGEDPGEGHGAEQTPDLPQLQPDEPGQSPKG